MRPGGQWASRPRVAAGYGDVAALATRKCRSVSFGFGCSTSARSRWRQRRCVSSTARAASLIRGTRATTR